MRSSPWGMTTPTVSPALHLQRGVPCESHGCRIWAVYIGATEALLERPVPRGGAIGNMNGPFARVDG